MLIQVFEAGPAATNGYVVADHENGRSLIIDTPHGTAAALANQARQWQAPVQSFVNTHAHWDHLLDNAEVRRLTGAQFGIHRDSVPLLDLPQTQWFGLEIAMPVCPPDFFLEEGRRLEVGDLKFEILHCPGHCPGSVALFEPKERVVFTGDVLFAGSIGRTDLPGGDHATLLTSIREKLLTLGDDVRVFAGHGPVTTIGRERRQNPFLVR
jgi:glyoxylase-like metal-dependent hydrolase (beta-lactamase superfamily II)